MPVLSIAMWVQPAATSQSANSRRARVVVANVRTCATRWPFGPGVRKHAATVFLWTSSPQHTAKQTSMVNLLYQSGGVSHVGEYPPRAVRDRTQQFEVPQSRPGHNFLGFS